MDGEINLVVEGETGPYLFNWSNGSFSQNLQNLIAGDYTVVVTDLNGQTETATITLYQPNELRVTLEPVVYDGGYHITAAGNSDGVIEAHVKGGTADYSYLWSNSETQYKAGGLSTGNYSVTVTDMNACTASTSVVLTQPTPLQVVSITSPMHNGYNVSCKDGSDGAINLVVAGGVQSQPYTFRWNTGQEAQNLSGIPVGNYSVRVRDAAGASVVTQITLTEPPLFKISGMVPSLYPNGKNLSCNTCSNGSITVNTTGGVGTPTYLWESGQTTQTISNQQAGTYFVTVTDLNGCTASSSKSLVAPERDDWSMFGNNGTNPNSQFMGTNDSADLVLKSNGTEMLRLMSSGEINSSRLAGADYDMLMVGPTGNILRVNPSGTPSGPLPGPLPGPSPLPLPCFAWNTCGNTLLPSHYLGSRNNADVVIKSNGQERIRITNDGIVGIGINPHTANITSGSQYKLLIGGKIGANEAWVSLGTPWPDFVFQKTYKIKSLQEIKEFVEEFKHLPDMPSAGEIAETGAFNLGEMQTKSIKEIEEIYLQLIKLNDRINELELQNIELKKIVSNK